METEKLLKHPPVNNAFYDDLGERWYQDDGHIIALLRAEAKLKLTYLRGIFEETQLSIGSSILDIGCGAGFISNELARDGFQLYGLDQSGGSLAVAARHAPPTTRISYTVGEAYHLPYASESFDSVLLLDILEHVDDPARMLAEASRVLKPKGLLFFHTFNRTLLSRFFAIEAVSFVARDSPKNFHVWNLFIKPEELKEMLQPLGLRVKSMRGIKPVLSHWPLWSSILKRQVHKDFAFSFTSSLSLGYIGYAQKFAATPDL